MEVLGRQLLIMITHAVVLLCAVQLCWAKTCELDDVLEGRMPDIEASGKLDGVEAKLLQAVHVFGTDTDQPEEDRFFDPNYAFFSCLQYCCESNECDFASSSINETLAKDDASQNCELYVCKPMDKCVMIENADRLTGTIQPVVVTTAAVASTTTPSPTTPSTNPSTAGAEANPAPKSTTQETTSSTTTPIPSQTPPPTTNPAPNPTTTPTTTAENPQPTASPVPKVATTVTTMNPVTSNFTGIPKLAGNNTSGALPGTTWTRHKMAPPLIAALAFGVLFVFSVMILLSKRIYDGYQRRHYQKIDYLVNGMYN